MGRPTPYYSKNEGFWDRSLRQRTKHKRRLSVDASLEAYEMPKPKGNVVADVLSPSGGRSGSRGPCGGRLYYCGWAVGEGGVTQTLARSGSTRTGSFHDLRQRPAHAVNPPHYEEKAEIERTSLLQVG